MMIETQNQLTWKELDPDTLQPDAKEAYENLQHIQAKAKAAREKFQKLFTKGAELPYTHRWLFSYKFDRLSVAVDVAKKPKKVGPKAIHFETLKAAVRSNNQKAES